ncbi:hypothetical protein HDR63_03065 [bacterium]|nr:hypothetical protein [bacterium]
MRRENPAPTPSVEPPVLLSRLLTFVFAGALVLVLVLLVTLVKMFPLNRPQIFFLTTRPRADLDIHLTAMAPDAENIDIYKRSFVKEYIKARNEIIPNVGVMRRKWSNSSDGIVNMWSTPAVYAALTQTNMWTAYMNDVPDTEFYCPVEFNSIAPRAADTYAVNFTYFCSNSDGQMDKKDYTIVIRLESDPNAIIKWRDRLANPLGIRVAEYTVESGRGDPLDFE